MNPLLILREEIVCLVILLFLLVNALAYQTGGTAGASCVWPSAPWDTWPARSWWCWP